MRYLHTMVRVMRGGEEVKISKRAGSYVTLRDLIEWTSKDAVRFFLLSRKPDTEYVFDVDLAVQKNNDNPVYYVQYAHARICSVLAKETGATPQSLAQADLGSLDSTAAQALMLELARYPEVLTAAASDFAPHDITFYLRDLAAAYHSYYDAERILADDPAMRRAYVAMEPGPRHHASAEARLQARKVADYLVSPAGQADLIEAANHRDEDGDGRLDRHLAPALGGVRRRNP